MPPVLPFPGLSIYWFPFGFDRPIPPPLDMVRFGWFAFDLRLIKALGLFV